MRDKIAHNAYLEGKAAGFYAGVSKGVLVGVMLHKTVQGSTLEEALALFTREDLASLAAQSGSIFGNLGG